METVKNLLLALLLALFGLALAFFPAEAADAARQGLALCLRSVLPSLFPFFVLASLVVSGGTAELLSRVLAPYLRPLFGVGGAGASALVLGLIGGYPVGARTVAELYRGGTLSRYEAERLLGFCNNAGPGFILGVCGGAVLQSARAGAYLYLVHVLSAALTGMALRPRVLAPQPMRPCPAPARRRSFVSVFPSSVRDSFAAVWSVCGFVVLFAVALRFMTLALPASAPFMGLIELTSGVLALSPGRQGFVRCAVLLGWGGLSVHAQTLSVLDESGLSTRRYFLGKILQAALSAPLAWVMSYGLF